MNDEDINFLCLCDLIATENVDKVSPTQKGVGCVIVKDGKIVGKGHRWTKILQNEPYKDITYHAEHCAIMHAGPECYGATLYTSFEPCTQRIYYEWPTPQCCCDIIARVGIKRVVFGKSDSGLGKGGTELLSKHGIKVEKID